MSDEVKYEFLGVVGEGGFGKVYRARMVGGAGFEKQVAIKLLSDENPPKSLLKRFRDEANLLGLIRDRAIVGVEPPILIGGRWAVVMEFVDGVSAGMLLEKDVLPPGVAIEIVGEVARALHNAYHMEGPEGEPLALIHRDIKPDNIQVTPTGDIRVLDFGIARANFASREFKTVRSFGGTPGYIAPERLDRIEVPEGDVYSLGVVLHELLLSTRPKPAPTVNFEQLKAGTLDLDAINLDELEVDLSAEQRADADLMEALRLSVWMRAYDPEERPAARQVEQICRGLRHKLKPPYLRDWAEGNVPARVELEADDRVNTVVSGLGGSTAATTYLGTPPPVGERDKSAVPVPQPPAQQQQMAVGAAMGAGALSLIIVAFLSVFAVGAGAFWLAARQNQPVAPPPVPVEPAPEPVPVAPDTPAPEEPKPAEPEPAEPEPAEPKPAEPAPEQPKPAPDEPRPVPVPAVPVVEIPIAEPDQPEPAQPQPPVLRPREKPSGMLIVNTIPSGASLRKGGSPLSKSGRGYKLPVGSHQLTLVSPNGETYAFFVNIKKDSTETLCYSFDTNSKCGG